MSFDHPNDLVPVKLRGSAARSRTLMLGAVASIALAGALANFQLSLAHLQ